MNIEKVFFKNVIVSCEVEKQENILSKVLNSDKIKRFKLELVAEDCENYIKDIIGKDVVIDFNGLKKISTENDRDYFISHQSNIIFL